MKIYRSVVLTAAGLVFSSILAKGQAIEFGAFGGISNYQGDLVEKSVDLEQTKFSEGLFFRYNITANYALRASLNHGVLAGSDASSADYERRERNLSFQTPLTEGAILFDFSPIGFNPSRGRNRKLCPYLFAGLGLIHFNPTAEYNGNWYALHDLSTEGQGLPEYPTRKPYKLTQLSYPFGIGARYNMSRHWNLGIEMRFGKTFTDYLDDVSGNYADPELILAYKGPTAAALADRRVELNKPPVNDFSLARGNSDNKDWYIFTGITIAYMPHVWRCYNF